MNKISFKQASLKENFQQEKLLEKDFDDKEKEFLDSLLYQVTTRYEFAKVLIQKNVWTAGDESEAFLYFIDGKQQPFQKRRDFAVYVFEKSIFIKNLKLSATYCPRCSEMLVRLIASAKKELIEYALSGVFKDIAQYGKNTPTF